MSSSAANSSSTSGTRAPAASPMTPRFADMGDVNWHWDAAADAWIRRCAPTEVTWAWHPHTRGEWELAARISARFDRPVPIDADKIRQAAVLARFRLPSLGVHTGGEMPDSMTFEYPCIHSSDDPQLWKWAGEVARLHTVRPDQDVETEAAKLLQAAYTTPMEGPHMLILTVVAKPNDPQLGLVFRWRHALYDVWGIGAVYHEFAKAVVTVLSDGLPNLKWGQEASNLPLVALQAVAHDQGDSPEQSKAAFDLLDTKMAGLAGKVSYSTPVRTGVAARQDDLRWSEWTLTRAETDRVVAASKKLGTTVTSLLTPAIWTSIKYVHLQSEPQTKSNAFVGGIIMNSRRGLKPEHRTHDSMPGWPTFSTTCVGLGVSSSKLPPGTEYTVSGASKEARALVPTFTAELKSCLGPGAFPARVAETSIPKFFKPDRFWDPSDPAGPATTVVSSMGVLDPPENGLLPRQVSHGRHLVLRTEDFHFRMRAFKRCNGFHPYTVAGRLTNVFNYNARIFDPAMVAEMMRVSKLVLLNLASTA